MEIDKLLHVAEEMSLKTFVWGAGVVDTLNKLLPQTQQITVEITGVQALTIIMALPPAAQASLLSIRLSLSTGRPLGEPDPVPAVVSPLPVASEDEGKKKSSNIPMIVAGVIVLISLILTVIMAAGAARTGAAPDEGAMRLILETLVTVLKLFLGDPSATPPPVV